MNREPDMGATTRRDVVVGVDQSPEALVAARYALWQAEKRGLDLVVLHTYSIPAMEAPLSDAYFACLREAAQAVVDKVLADIEVPATVTVKTLLQQTAPALLLQRAAETAQLVVIGQHHSGWFERLIAGSVVNPLCKNAACPVIIVPKAWQRSWHNDQPVVVALDGQSAGAKALQVAFEEAELQQTAVVALHAMPPEASPDLVATQEHNLAELLSGYERDHPHILVRVKTVTGDPDKALGQASQDAALLVVGAPRGNRLGSWSRSVARGVLKQAACPVAVVPRTTD
jgi:nucleotide-binding universal stress UspA family protein